MDGLWPTLLLLFLLWPVAYRGSRRAVDGLWPTLLLPFSAVACGLLCCCFFLLWPVAYGLWPTLLVPDH